MRRERENKEQRFSERNEWQAEDGGGKERVQELGKGRRSEDGICDEA